VGHLQLRVGQRDGLFEQLDRPESKPVISNLKPRIFGGMRS
jgi:hypothetical protein